MLRLAVTIAFAIHRSRSGRVVCHESSHQRVDQPTAPSDKGSQMANLAVQVQPGADANGVGIRGGGGSAARFGPACAR
jgi:hypothetical protein